MCMLRDARSDADVPVVLVLDDNPTSIAAIRADLRGAFTVIEAREFARALDILGAVADIVAVVAHVNLARGVGGASFMVEVEQRAPWCARVLLSESASARESAEDFAHAFVKRPWSHGTLADTLARILADRSQPHRLHRPHKAPIAR